MMSTLLHQLVYWLLCVAVCSSVAGAEAGSELNVPTDFLTLQGTMPKVLEVPVSGNFQAAPVEDVLAALCSPLGVSHSYGEGYPSVTPAFTGTFKDVPLRTALFQLAQQCKLQMELVKLEPSGHWFISVRPRTAQK